MKRIVSFVISAVTLILFAVAPCAAAEKELHWYCTRQKAHRQALASSELRFVEECGGYYIDHAHGEDANEMVVYLTFDAGYENGNVEKILNVLKETQTPAAFFVLKHLVTTNTELLRRMNAEGHLVCNHTATHKNLANASKEKIAEELRNLEQACKDVGIRTAPYFRPPEGSFSRELLLCARELGYKTVFWSFAYADWDNERQMPPSKALRCVMDNIHNGAVLLLHPTSATNVEILPSIIAELKSQGYRFGTLDELCGA